MQSEWTNADDPKNNKQVISPLSLIVSAFATLDNIYPNQTPLLQSEEKHPTDLWLIDLGLSKNRLKHSIADEMNSITSKSNFTPYNQVADIEPQTLIYGFQLIHTLRQKNLLLAYHDRSDGGLWTSLCEMLFTNDCSLHIAQKNHCEEQLTAWLLNEEIGMIIQTPQAKRMEIEKIFAHSPLSTHCQYLGSPKSHSDPKQTATLTLSTATTKHIFAISDLKNNWSETSYHLKKLRDNPQCVTQEKQHPSVLNPHLTPKLTSQLQSTAYQQSIQQAQTPSTPALIKTRPKIAILREQGINGHQEMAFAFYRAGLQPIDVHMSDILKGSTVLQDCVGLAACGGFSYGDVLGAGGGWAKSILFNPFAYQQFKQFFHRPNTFTLGVCNGCQMLSHLKEIIPGAENWSTFSHNQSQQFEARLIQIKITPSPSILLQDMEDNILPVIVSHGEGRINSEQALPPTENQCAHYVDANHQATTQYPANPNGSANGITALTSTDGRATIMMPHPERTFRLSQYSWHPKEWQKFNDISPWMKLFTNAKTFTKQV